jgi:hypothetical protein
MLFVTGTGSSGTTFFIQLLSELGLTNIDSLFFNKRVKGGYEVRINRNTSYPIRGKDIVKDPIFFFIDHKAEALDRAEANGSKVTGIWLCMRPFEEAIKSRSSRGIMIYPDKDISENLSRYKDHLLDFIEVVSSKDIPLVLVDYNLLSDFEYCYRQIVQFCSVEKSAVELAHKKLYNPSYKNTYK